MLILGLVLVVVVAGPAGAGDDPPAKPVAPSPPIKLARIEDFAPPEEFVTVGGIKTHVVRQGDHGPVVVLVHGFGASTYTWRKTIGPLARGHRVFALDMKGFGLTAKPRDGAYHPRAYAEHLLAFLDAMKIDRAILVGHSLGGAVVTRLALRHPERVSGLVLVAPAPLGMSARASAPPPVADRDRDGPKRMRPVNLGPVPSLAVRMVPLLLRTTITRERVQAGLASAFHDPSLVTPEMVEVYHRPITIEGGAEALAAMMNPPPSAVDGPLPPLDALKIPTLVAVGAHDRLVPPPSAESYVRAIPGAEKVVFDRSGHVPHEEEADAFNARLLAFLTRFRSP